MARTQTTGRDVLNGTIELIDLSDALVAAIFGSQSPGWYNIILGREVNVESGDIKFAAKFEKQSGYIKHSGFIKGNA